MPAISILIDVPARGGLTAPAEVWPNVRTQVCDHENLVCPSPGDDP